MIAEMGLWVGLLYGTTLRVTVVLAVCALILRALRNVPASHRAAVTGASMIIVMLFPASRAVPSSGPLEVMPGMLAQPIIHAGVTVFAGAPSPHLTNLGGDPVDRGRLSTAGWIYAIVLSVWIAGAAAVLLWLFAGLTVVRRSHLRATRCTRPDLIGIVEEARTLVGVARHVELLLDLTTVVPFTWRGMRPVIVLPAGAVSWAPDVVRAIVVHEMAHVRAWDSPTRTLSTIACVLYWFHPGVWWLARRHAAEREIACDDEVLRAKINAADYAEVLMASAELAQRSQPQMRFVPTVVSAPFFLQRVRLLLDARRPRARLGRTGLALAGAIAVFVASAMASTRLAPTRGVTTTLLESPDWVHRAYGLAVLSGVVAARGVDEEAVELLRASKGKDPHPVNRAIAGSGLKPVDSIR